MRYIPVSVCDNFFDDPDSIVNYANSLEYTQTSLIYPGVRSADLQMINPELHHHIAEKFFILFMGIQRFNYNGIMFFQKLDPGYKHGVVHKDDGITGIIYLNKQTEINCGTSIYNKKSDVLFVDGRYDEKTELIANKDYNSWQKHYQTVNSQFEKSIDIRDKYNRLIAFDSEWHAANNIDNGVGGERLTLCMFMRGYGEMPFDNIAARAQL
jgi:hypothetical protein